MPDLSVVEVSELTEFLVDGARYGDIEDVESALEQKADVNSCNEYNQTALHMAAGNGYADIVELLLDKGADPNAINREGSTPLHWACLNKHTKVIQLLLKAGAGPSVLNSAGQTPVDAAFSTGYDQQISDLINSFQTHSAEPTSGMPVDEEAEETHAPSQ